MLSSKTLIVWLVGLCIAYSSSAPSSKKTLVKYYTSPNKSITFDPSGFNETHVAYRTCNHKEHEIQCEITLDSLDGQDKSLSCNVTVKSSNDNASFMNVERLVLLNNGRVFLYAISHEVSIILSNLNLNDCSAKQTEFYYGKETPPLGVIAVYKDSYDFFFPNTTLCQTHICRMTYDFEGNILKGAEPWGVTLDELQYYSGDVVIQTVAPNSLKNGLLFINHRANKPYTFLYNSDGKKILTTGELHVSNLAVSTIGDNIGTCLQNWGKKSKESGEIETLECKRYDLGGKLLKTELQADATSIVGDGKQIFEIGRLNLPEGFLLFAIVCPENDGKRCLNSPSYFVYRFNGNGEKLKEIEINDFKCGPQFFAHISPKPFKNAAGQSCVTMACPQFESKHEFMIGVRCFTDEELL